MTPADSTYADEIRAIEEKLKRLDESWRRFKKTTDAIAEEQRRLLARLQGFIDQKKLEKAKAALRSIK